MAAAARVIRGPANNRLGGRSTCATVAKRRLRGSARLRDIFRADAAGWPHRASADRASPLGPALGTRSCAMVTRQTSSPIMSRTALPSRAVQVLGGRGRLERATCRGVTLRHVSAKPIAAGKPARRFIAATSQLPKAEIRRNSLKYLFLKDYFVCITVKSGNSPPASAMSTRSTRAARGPRSAQRMISATALSSLGVLRLPASFSLAHTSRLS